MYCFSVVNLSAVSVCTAINSLSVSSHLDRNTSNTPSLEITRDHELVGTANGRPGVRVVGDRQTVWSLSTVTCTSTAIMLADAAGCARDTLAAEMVSL